MIAALTLALALTQLEPTVSVDSALREMVDFDRLAYPLPYKHAQASSYDRDSNPGPNSNPFANGDFGQFVRSEQMPGRTEYVMADLTGPGMVDRLWSANPLGVVRFYFDGETTPRFQADMKALFTGQVPPFGAPFGYVASHGCNLYFPFPYQKSLKITVDDSGKDKPKSLYYHVGYRTYPAGTSVESFDPTSLGSVRTEMSEVATRLETDQTPTGTPVNAKAVVRPGKSSALLQLKGAGIVREFSVKLSLPSPTLEKAMAWTDPHRDINVLRSLLLTVAVDGQTCIQTPLGDFFGSAPGLNPYRTLAASMSPDGTLSFRLPMPFANGFTARVENVGKVKVPITVSAIVDRSKRTPFPPYRLHSQWTVERGHSRPFKDMNLLSVTGQGTWVGCNLAVANPSSAWWGEGDEKAYVDGESFPSTFGTGTEDFFGYAWSSPDLFERPYHAQSRADGPGNMGHASVVRWQLFDPIPYTTSLKFDLERWHWADVIATYARTAYWYAPADSAPPVKIDRSLLAPEEVKPFKVTGALEGESLSILEKSGGVTEVQGGFGELSNGAQLWWRDASIGDHLALKIPVTKAGKYEVIVVVGNARDYGNFQIKLNGLDCGTHDFYRDGLGWGPLSLGVFQLSKGNLRLDLTVLAHNPAAAPNNMFGLDYILLKPTP